MIELKDIQDGYNRSRQDLDPLNVELLKTNAELEKLIATEKQELKILDRQSMEARKRLYADEKNRLENTIDNLNSRKKDIHDQFTGLSTGFFSQLNPESLVNELDDALPILLFPLRLETRFKSTGSQQQLWLRVYPDDCNINSKEDLLSESELSNAKEFWLSIWKSGGIEAEERAGWKNLVNSHGSGRSAWIIQEFKPLNDAPSKPDSSHKILVVNSSLALTPDETKAARQYWAEIWLAGGNATLINTAFNSLVTATNTSRADEIKTQYEPLNLSDAIPEGIVNEKILLSKIELPPYTPKQTSWTQASKTMALPDKFVAITINGPTKENRLFPNRVKENLPVSLDPSLAKDDQLKRDNGNLILNEELQWIFDFEKAVEVGMALKINLTQDEAINGFDKIFVVGIRFSSDKTDGSVQLEKLLTDHFYSNAGFSLLKQGTPTNNTEELPSGYSWIDDADQSYQNIFRQIEAFLPSDEPVKKSDGEKLADCLGISDTFLKKVPNANGRDQLEANAMNTALFPATMGYFMDEMMNPLFSDRDIEATKMFFSNFVSGRGPIPAIRIGKQPYGILPVSVYSKLKFASQSSVGIAINNAQKPFLERLYNLIMQMDKTWDSLVQDVPHIDKDGDAHQNLLDVISLHANSVEFHQRYAQSIKQLYNQINLQVGPTFAKKITTHFETKANTILKDLKLTDPNLRIPALDKYFLSKPNLLNGPLIDDVPDSEINAVRVYYSKGDTKLNYIEWLATAEPDAIRTENFEGKPSPAALLYLLLRHALLLSQADAGTKLLETNRLLSDRKAYFDPVFLHLSKTEKGKSKFEHLYSNFPEITGSSDSNTRLVDHLYKPELLKLEETKNLKDILDALNVLKQTPTARLERLLVEHLDCCSYRIDAWKTGLVQYKLTEQRNFGQQNGKPSKGIYLGAYGWLLNVRSENKILTDINLSPALNKIFNEGNTTKLQTDNTNLGYIHAPSLNQAATAAILRNAYDSNKDAGTENPFAINLTSDRVRIAESFLEGIRNGQSLSALLGYQFERGLHDKHGLNQGEVDMFIYPLRKVFPLVADNINDTKTTATDISEAVEANSLSGDSKAIQNIEASNVVDGLKLINHLKTSTSKTYPYDPIVDSNLPAANSTQTAAIDDEIKRITGIHDAIADLVMSEQVYQVVQGNFERAAGTADAFSKGSYPPDIAIKDTPRSGVTLTHRMAIHFDADVAPDAVGTPRAKAEPSVNQWLADNLPKPENVQCSVSYSTPAQVELEVIVSQKDLGLQPIDLLYTFNMDTEQSMTELDDRITAFIRYKKSLHPKTDIEINYTKIIDPVDRSIISFFELAALIKSLRKIITGNKFLTPAQLTLSSEGQQQSYVMDDVTLRDRIISLRDVDLSPLKAAMELVVTGTSSIKKITDNFKVELTPLITDASKLGSILATLQQDLKDFLINPVAAAKTEILTRFENNISIIGVAATINNLKAAYGNSLDQYLADLSNFDVLAERSIAQSLSAAMLDNTQTGTGFIHQGIGNIYQSIFVKLDKLFVKWAQKKTDFDTTMDDYDPLGIPDEQFLLLQKAELIISSRQTQPMPADFVDYRTIHIGAAENAFDDLLHDLRALKINGAAKIIDFITQAESHIIKIANHDVVAFDTVREKNDLGAEKLMLALLKEDILNAMSSLISTMGEKFKNCTALVEQADKTTINADKITLLLNAAKLVFGEQALLLPQFSLPVQQGNEFENACTGADDLLNFVRAKEKRILPVEDWIAGVARVRDKIHHWENTSFLYSAFKPAANLDMLDIMALQFPYMPDDRWLALKFRDETDPLEIDEDGNFKFKINNDKLLYSAHFVKSFDKTKPQCGVVVDEWTEVIPSDKETTGIAFHYDQPDSEPPQTMLLVTPPVMEGTWKWDNIIDAMNETLDMAKKRAVEPVQIEKTRYAHFLPATLMAVTMHPITVAVNFSAMNKFNKSENN